jgi:23S rRNA (adenine2503-C2)-methyltransferase
LSVRTAQLDPRDLAPGQFLSSVERLAQPVEAARRLMARVVGQGIFCPRTLNQQHRIPRQLCDAMGVLPRLRLVASAKSPTDCFEKLAFATHDNLVLETVLIPLHKPGAVSVCLSSQVGCPMGCLFCATARMPTRRNLTSWEIVDQVIQSREWVRREGRRVSGAVFMGMGEPFLNYERVLDAAEILSAPFGAAISGPAITISTVGLVPEIDRFTKERRRFRLSISLGAATDEKRRQVVPLAAKTPVVDVIAAARRHIAARGQGRMMLAYVCIGNFNCGEEDARALGELIGDMPVRLDLIEVTDPTGQFQPPQEQELRAFRDALTRHVGQPVVRRYSGGKDISAACGTLAGTFVESS